MPQGRDAFENDLLISYAHLDDEPLLEGQPGWISWMHPILERLVTQRLGKKSRVWRDPKLQGNDYFADTILTEQLPKAAALVSVVSPLYVESEWCVREVKEFCRLSEQTGGVRIGDKARIFKIIKTPVPLERHPHELQSLLGYEFFVRDPETGRPHELSQAYGPEAVQKFITRLNDVACDIVRLLEQLKGNGSSAAPKGTVFLADTSSDILDERDAVKRDLEHNGYRVLPDRPLPFVAEELEPVLREQLARCTLSVHLIGRSYGVVPEGSAQSSMVAIQHDLAVELPGLSRLIWIAPGLEVKDERQRAFIQHLRTAPGVHAAAELLEVSLENLKSVVHRKLAPPVEPKKETPPAVSAAGDPARVYLICDQPDREAVRPLKNYLFERGCEAVLPLFDDDEAETRLEHEASLCSCDAVLLYYGEAEEPWLRRKLREIQRSAGLGRERPLLARGIYLAPPRTPHKEEFRTLEAMVLHAPPSGFSPAVLDPFLAGLERQRGEAGA